MTKTLLVSYTPRVDSNTKKLVDAFLQASEGKAEITHLDLVNTPPPLLLHDNLNTLLKRNFMGMALSEEEEKSVQTEDHFTAQLQSADRIVIAFPMFNYSLPATVKAWIDNVVQAGKTFKLTEQGYEGLCHDKKALILLTTGVDYTDPEMAPMDFATPLMQTCLGFMGIESEVISAQGLNLYADRVDAIVNDAQLAITDFVNNDKTW